MASSPYAKERRTLQRLPQHYGKDGAKVLVWKSSTWQMNPRAHKRIVDEAYERRSGRRQGRIWRRVPRRSGRFRHPRDGGRGDHGGRSELPPEPGVTYSAFATRRAAAQDAMTLAIGHLSKNGVCVLDALLEIRPPFDPEAAVDRSAPRFCAVMAWRRSLATNTPASGRAPDFAEHGDRIRAIRPAEERPLSRLSAAAERPSGRAARPAALVGPIVRPRAAHRAQRQGLDRSWPRRARRPRQRGRRRSWSASTSTAGNRWSSSTTCSPSTARGRRSRWPCRAMSGLMTFAVVAMEGADVAVVYSAHLKMQPPLYILDVAAGPLWRDFFTDTAAQLDEFRRACLAHTAAGFRPDRPPAAVCRRRERMA